MKALLALAFLLAIGGCAPKAPRSALRPAFVTYTMADADAHQRVLVAVERADLQTADETTAGFAVATVWQYRYTRASVQVTEAPVLGEVRNRLDSRVRTVETTKTRRIRFRVSLGGGRSTVVPEIETGTFSVNESSGNSATARVAVPMTERQAAAEEDASYRRLLVALIEELKR